MRTEKKGYFITLEGIEGAGKSTGMKFIHKWLIEKEIPHILTREPGGTEISEDIRHLLLKHHTEPMASDTELLLMFASRAQHIANLIRPALERGEWVLCDRFTDASYAYQGGGRGVDSKRIAQLESWVQGELRPDRVILLDIPAERGLQRIRRRRSTDRFEVEKLSFFKRARQAYLSRASQDPGRYVVVNASQNVEKVRAQIRSVLEGLEKI
jgi:dTMP kinase